MNENLNKNSHFSLTTEKVNWLTEAVVPILLVLIVWVAYYIIREDLPYAYERVLSGGDLFAIAFTLMLSSLFEFTSFKAKKTIKDEADKTVALLKLGGVLFLVLSSIFYAIAKFYTMENSIPDAESECLPSRFTMLAHCSLASCLFIVAFIYFGKSCLEKHKS